VRQSIIVKSMVKRYSLHGGQEAERHAKRGQGHDIPCKEMPPVTYFL
jgi:hypothetical protein